MKLCICWIFLLGICYSKIDPILKENYNAKYAFNLYEVERSVIASHKYGEIMIVELDSSTGFISSFQDSLINVSWNIQTDSVHCLVRNLSSYSIKVLWDDAAFIDENGISYRIVTGNTRKIFENISQPPSIIAKSSDLDEYIFPVNYKPSFLEVDTNYIGNSYDLNYFFEFCKNAKTNIGKSITILLPFKVENITNEYLFKFRINDIKLTKNVVIEKKEVSDKSIIKAITFIVLGLFLLVAIPMVISTS